MASFATPTTGGSGAGTPAGSSGQVQFNSSGSFGADTNIFWDNSNKRLGIGTNAPGTPQQCIAGNADFRFSKGISSVTPSLICINTDSGGKAAGITCGTIGSSFVFDDSGVFNIQAEPKSNFSSNSVGAGAALFRVNSSGSSNILNGLTVGVAIGSDPTSGLHVNNYNAGYSLNVKTATDNIISVRSANSGIQILARNDADSAYQLMQIDASNLVLCLNSGGKVGINTASPGEKLEVNGNIKWNGLRSLGFTSTSSDPTTTELPNNKDTSIHKNTTSGACFLAFNDSGTIKKVAMT